MNSTTQTTPLSDASTSPCTSQELTLRVARALQRAANHRRLLPYAKFHALFDGPVPLCKRYQALESAIGVLGDLTEIDYGALLACDNGLPGPDFFQRFRRYRLDDFVAVMGDPRFCRQSRKLQRVLADRERERVYAHVMESAHAMEDLL
jgi:hypothetical protein